MGQDTASVLDDQSTLLLDPQLTRPVITPQSDMPAPDEAAIWLMTPSLIFDGATHSTSPYTLSYPQQPPPPPIYLLHWRTLMLHQWIAAGGFLVFVISLACGLALQSLPTHEAIATSTARAGGALTAVAPAITSHQMPSRSTPVAPQLSPPPSIVPLRDTHPQAVHAQKHSAHGQHHGKHPHRGHDDDG
ncbi:MAG TPA: hypothetical protein VKB76_02445 [Ktedonobacterales bacterium]|nr:hypothetical protein [Ktedonobacterales bacterium]